MKNLQIVISILFGLLVAGSVISGQSNPDAFGKVSSSGINSVTSRYNVDSISYLQPPANKKIGLGINTIRTVVYIGNEFQIRGAVSVFCIDRQAEIAFPFQYNSGKDANITYRVFYSEATYRSFTGKQQKGFYFSGGVRYAYIEGEILDDSAEFGSPQEHTGMISKQNKFGVYAGIGYRYFTMKGYYLGGNIIAGAYFGPRTPYIAMTEDLAYNFILG
jgi:hypothetical protein